MPIQMYIRHFLIFFTTFWLSLSFVWAQPVVRLNDLSKSDRNQYDKIVQKSTIEPRSALVEMRRFMGRNNNFVDGWIKLGGVAYDVQFYEEAAGAFHKALTLDSLSSPAALFFLAKSEIALKKFDKASEHLEQLKRHPKYAISGYQNKTQPLIQQISKLKEIASLTYEFKPVKLPAGINTSFHEYLPTISADGTKLVFARVNGDEDFYISSFENGQWQTAIPIDSINTKENEAAQTISADGRTIIFTRCNAFTSCDLFLTQFRQGVWSAPVRFPEPINSRFWDSQPSLSPDGQRLYFVSNRPGGFGASDVYVSVFDGRTFGTPINLGQTINTAGREATPFMHMDGRSLYFASEGHPSFGSMDLFVAFWENDTLWSEPLNLGSPINSIDSEEGLTVSRNGTTAIMARKENDHFDLFQFELPPHARANPTTYLRAEIVDENDRPVRSQIEIRQLSNNRVVLKTQARNDGSIFSCLPLGQKYAFVAQEPGYLLHSENFEPDGEASLDNPYLLKIKLRRIPVAAPDKPTLENEKPVVLRNVFFDTGSSMLKPESFFELDQLVSVLKTQPTLRIHVMGHTDNVGQAAANKKLSNDRAESVYNYLKTKGIDTDRLKFSGYGADKPVATNDSAEGRQQNRRTEFTVW